jgi:hypothetical protein
MPEGTATRPYNSHIIFAAIYEERVAREPLRFAP